MCLGLIYFNAFVISCIYPVKNSRESSCIAHDDDDYAILRFLISSFGFKSNDQPEESCRKACFVVKASFKFHVIRLYVFIAVDIF